MAGMDIRVTMIDGVTHDVSVINPDRIKWDRAAHKHKWPTFQEAPFIGLTFLAWAAMTRTGLTADTWDTFADQTCADVESIADEAAEVDPTQTAPQPA